MVLHEIRETINNSASTTDGRIIMQKKINLKHGKRHNILHMDWFDDAISGATNSAANMKMEVYLTNYPIILSDTVFHNGSATGGPLAGDDEVLFKAHRLSWSSGNARWINNEFPNQFLGSTPTFDFYTPELYFTVIFNDESNSDYTRTIQQSIYLAVNSVDINPVEYGIGLLREYNENQMRLLTANGLLISQADVIGASPTWRMGGIRPELMTSNDSPDTFFYSLAGYGAAEGMVTTTQVRDAVEASRTMVSSLDAFGDVTTEAPDWFKVIVRDFPSLASGPVRSQQPPLRHYDNGNVEMF